MNGDPSMAYIEDESELKVVADSINQISEFMAENADKDAALFKSISDIKIFPQSKIVDQDDDLDGNEKFNNENNNLGVNLKPGFDTMLSHHDQNNIQNEPPILHTDPYKNKYNFRVFIYCYTVGKEEICLELARYYNTKIVLDRDRYRMIKSLNYNLHYFTNDPNEGFIHLTKGLNSVHKNPRNDVIHISLTGWINCKSYLCLKKGEYQVAYSSHSNYQELERFVSIINPGVINPIVIERQESMDLNEEGIKSMAGYFFWLRNFKKRGMEILSSLTRREIRE
jgi:hypothetical protein